MLLLLAELGGLGDVTFLPRPIGTLSGKPVSLPMQSRSMHFFVEFNAVE